MISKSALVLTLILSISATAALAAPPTVTTKPTIDQAALDKLGWTLGCQAWTLRSLTLTETLDTLHALGIHAIEIYPTQHFSPEKPDVIFNHNSPPELIEEFLAKCKADDVTPVSYGVVGLDANEKNDRIVFDFAKKLGLKNIVSEPSTDSFDLLDKLTEEYQIKVAIHDHPKPSHYWNPDTVLEVIKGHSDRIGSCADVGHWYRSGLVPVDCLKKLDGHIIEFHFKDIDNVGGKMEDVPWGTGKCNVPAMLAEIKRQNIHGVFSIEYESGEGEVLIGNLVKCINFYSQQATELAKGTP